MTSDCICIQAIYAIYRTEIEIVEDLKMVINVRYSSMAQFVHYIVNAELSIKDLTHTHSHIQGEECKRT